MRQRCALAAWVWLALLGLAACRAPETPVLPVLSGELPVTAPTVARVGEPIEVLVGPATGVRGTPATLVAIGPYGARTYRSQFQDAYAAFTIPTSDTRRSGLVHLVVRAQDARGDAMLRLEPGPPVDPITPLVGPRTIIADGEHWTMITVIPFDRYGNPMPDGTPVEIRALHPGNQQEERLTPVQHLLAWARLFSNTTAGRTLVTAEVEGVPGLEGSFLEVPGRPVGISLAVEPDQLPADGRQLATIRTGLLQDRFGNVLPDGTQVTFIAQSDNGDRRLIPAHVLDGIAQAPLQAPVAPDTLRVKAALYGVESEAAWIMFTAGPAVGTFPLALTQQQVEGALVLEAGPMTGPLGQLIPDGTQVLFKLTDQAGRSWWQAGTSDNGRAIAQFRLLELEPGRYDAIAFAGSGRGTTTIDLPVP